MIKNYFYLIVGILCLLFAVTHTWNGLEKILPVLDDSEIDVGTKTIFTYVWHVIAVENLVFGISLLIMAFRKNREEVKFTAWVIVALLVVRWIVITLFTVLNAEGNIMDLLPDTIAISVVVILILLGTRKKSKPVA
jgi:hypothetical protein